MGKGDSKAAWFLLAAIVIWFALRLCACGPLPPARTADALEKLNAGLRVAQCVEQAMGDVSAAEAKAALLQPPPEPSHD